MESEILRVVGTIARMWADNTYSSFTDSLVELMQVTERTICGPGEMLLYNKATISWHSGARNQIVEDAEGEWIFMLDTDHVFAPDLLIRLLEIRKKYGTEVLSGVYQYKHHPHGPVAGFWQGDKALAPLADWDRSAEILEVGAVGAGCLLVDRKVYNRIKRELGELPFDITEGLSEDYSFCRRCRKLGIPVYLAPRVQCHHTIRTVLDLEDYRPPAQTKAVQIVNGGIAEKVAETAGGTQDAGDTK